MAEKRYEPGTAGKIGKTFFVWISAAVVWLAAFFRAWSACLTYDEAFSYCYYIHPLQLMKWSSLKAVFTDCLANNHILNTVLCNLAVKFSGRTWNEFVIRVPVLLFCVVYLAMILLLFHKKKINCITAAFLIWNYYLNEFFSLARGYGLAAGMVMAALVMYQFWCDSGCRKNRYLSLFLLFMTLGVMANTIVLLAFAAFLPYICMRLIQNRKLFCYVGRQCFVWVPLLAVNVLMLRYHLMVTAEDKPLYVGAEGIWRSMWKGYAQTFVPNGAAAQILAVLALILSIAGIALAIANRSFIKNSYMIPVLTYMIIVLILQYVIKSGVPTGRTLLPAYPLMILFWTGCAKEIRCLIERRPFSTDGKKKYRWTMDMLGAAVCLVLVALFLRRADFEAYSDWYDEKDYKKIAYDAVSNPEADFEAIANMDYPMQYYWAQIYLQKGFDIYTGQSVQ